MNNYDTDIVLDEDSTAEEGIEVVRSQIETALDYLGEMPPNEKVVACTELLLTAIEALEFTLEAMGDIHFELDFNLDEKDCH